MGLLIARKAQGEKVNRFYFRGRAHLERGPMRVERRGSLRKRHPTAKFGARAWRDSLTLYPYERNRFREFLRGFKGTQARIGAPLTITASGAKRGCL
jgi:hypothetical protein